MNIAVIYRSMTGHSKKLARAAAEALGTEALDIKRKPVLKDVDLLFVAGGVYGGKSLNGMTDYIKTLDASGVKRAALITSSASDKHGQDDVRAILTGNGVEVEAEEYRCYGNFLFVKLGRPNKTEIAGAAEFVKKIAGRYSRTR